MKKIALLMIACLATVSLIACGKTADTATVSESPESPVDAVADAVSTAGAAAADAANSAKDAVADTAATAESAVADAAATAESAVADAAATAETVTDVTDATIVIPADFPAELSILNATPIATNGVPNGNMVTYTITGTQDDAKKAYKTALEALGAKDIKETTEKTAEGLDQLLLTGKTDTSVITIGLLADTNTPDAIVSIVNVVAANATTTAAQ